MKRLILSVSIVVFSLSSVQIHGDGGFDTTPKREALLLGGGICLCALAGYAYTRMCPPSPATLDENRIFFLDRFAVDLSVGGTALVSDLTCALCVGLPLACVAKSGCCRIVGEDMLMYVESVLFMAGLTGLSKAVFKRPRPYAYRMAASSGGSLSKSAVRSFFSGHTASAFNGAVFAGTVFQRRYPDSPWVKPVWIVGMTAAVATAVFRVTSGNHFPTDVVGGALVGSFTGWLIPRIHRREEEGSVSFGTVGQCVAIRLYF